MLANNDEELGKERVRVEGEGGTVRVDVEATKRGLSPRPREYD